MKLLVYFYIFKWEIRFLAYLVLYNLGDSIPFFIIDV